MFCEVVKGFLNHEERKHILPDAFSHACILDAARFMFYIFEHNRKILLWKSEQCIDAIISSFVHSSKFLEEKLFLLTEFSGDLGF